MRYTGPKNRLSRREGIDLGLKTVGSKSQSNCLKKINIIPGQFGTSRHKKMTDYGSQLRENQKVKRMYGLTQSSMKKYYKIASRTKGNTSELIIKLIEMRIDNVIYKLGLSPTRSSARQLINHGHILVNGKKVSIPSYNLRVNDKISFKKEATTQIPYITEFLKRTDMVIPNWLDRKELTGKIIKVPETKDFTEDINMQLVVEYYSR